MATQEGYYILIYSPSLNQTHREFDLVDGITTDQRMAQIQADAGAARFNQMFYNHAADWVGKIEWKQMGIETFPGYLS